MPRTQTHGNGINIMDKLEAAVISQSNQIDGGYIKSSAMIKDLKRVKELERKRRSLLIYGTEDMRTVI